MGNLETLSQIASFVARAEYAAGWEAFQALSCPTPQDERWGGVCLYSLGRTLDARALLNRARLRGEDAALIDLATVARLAGELPLARRLIREALELTLTRSDQVRALLERGVLLQVGGDLGLAAVALEDAWVLTQSGCDGWVEARAAQLLGYVESERGYDARAQWYISRALELAAPSRRAWVLTTRATINLFLGLDDLARDDLRESVALNGEVAHSAAFAYLSALIHQQRGELEPARQSFAVAAERAAGAGDGEFECYARLYVCAALTGQGFLDDARAELQRAKPRAGSPPLRALVAMREGALLAARGELAQAGARLEEALEGFEALGLGRECAWTHLHKAARHLSDGDEAGAALALESAVDVAHTLGGTAFLALELHALPNAAALAKVATPYGRAALRLPDPQHVPVGRPATAFRLITLGRQRLLAGGQPVHLSLTRAVEVLAYLLAYPGSTLEAIITDVFGDQDPKSAQNYFHQVKHQLLRSGVGLSIQFDRETRTYRVDHGACPLEWDLEEFKNLLRAGGEDGLTRALDLYTGPFLRHSSAEWAEGVRSELEWSIIKSGLSTLQGFYEAGQFEKCRRLAGRLLQIEPLDEGLNEYLVRTTAELEGALSARATLRHIDERFVSEVGELPPSLTALKKRFETTVN